MTTPPTRRQRWRDRKRYRRTTWLLAAAVALVIGLGVAGGAWWMQRSQESTSAKPGEYVPPSDLTPPPQEDTGMPRSSPTSSSGSEAPSSTSTPSSTSASSSSPSSTAAQGSDSSDDDASDDATSDGPTTDDANGSEAVGDTSNSETPSGEPTRVQIESDGRSVVDTSLEATTLDAEKVLAPDFGTAGWYAEPGWPKPGYSGASILVGHINHGGEPDVFWNLPEVEIGDIVTVSYGSGDQVQFEITKSEAASKAGVPQDDSIWDHDNPEPVLRLITCDPETPLNEGHYEGNWVVWADKIVG